MSSPDLVCTGKLLLPSASPGSAAMALGAAIGLALSGALVLTGVLKRSYEAPDGQNADNTVIGNTEKNGESPEASPQQPEYEFNHRLEACREIVFLLPIVACSVAALWASSHVAAVNTWWDGFSQRPVVAGLLGSLWGYFVGCGVVWGVRIFGTLAFGKEAMGLGDVHLMGAAGAVVGPLLVVVAFFIAPFFGLAWAGFQMFFKKIRQIPYGPFLSLGIFIVMILHDLILDRIGFIFYR